MGERGEGKAEGEAGFPWSREPIMGLHPSIPGTPGPRDHDLSPRHTLNKLSHPGAPEYISITSVHMEISAYKVVL